MATLMLRRLHAIRRRIKRAEALCEAVILPQMNWQDVGRELRKQFIARADLPCSCYWCRVYQATPRGQRKNYWCFVISKAISGDPSSLVRHLRSRRKLTRFDRNELAEHFEDVFTNALQRPTTQRGRPKHSWAQMCVHVAIKFYQDWKDANQRNGINDWGHRDEMKDEASRLAIELGGSAWARTCIGQDPPTFEQVRELMERPAARRR
jgi:hypothetical protein